MSELVDSKTLYQATCDSNSEPYALQNIGDMMSPEFSESCIIIIDPSMSIHHEAYVIVDFEDELYFRPIILLPVFRILRCL
ncbi:S24 family peptidase, partial [Candidatus Pseudothioglobus singularis]|uniref:S24 family peptidase n=1 Tax=Candidatus Pseudothioglobus singularis TaxID=1427364 RepID=UPI003D9C3DA4